MKLGDRLQEIRDDQGLSQLELATRVKTSQSTISQLEQGTRNPSYQMLRRLAEALNVSVSYLLGEQDLKELSPEEEAHFRELRGLPKAARTQLQEYMQFLKQRSGERSGGGDADG